MLWGHGNGAKTGLFIDELFGNDVMYLYELKDALQRDAVLERIEIRWDGERMIFQEGFTWEGSYRVEWTD